MNTVTAMRSTTVAFCLICWFCPTGAVAQGDGDYDGDGDVDGDDFFYWAGCMTGPAGGPLDPGCDAFNFYLDFGPDGSVDMADLWAFQRAPTGPGGCTPGKKYAYAQKVGSATGCSGKITTRNTTLCGGTSATWEAGSNAWVGVSKYVGTNPDNWKWAQTGYIRFRNPGSTTVQLQKYAEIQAGPPPANYHYEPAPWPGDLPPEN